MLADTIKSNMIQNKTTGVLFFDYTDAFGSVNRNKLLHKLCNNFDVSGRLLLYLHIFWSDRQARLRVNDLIGEWLSSDSGMSTGTILGALLFIAYVHDTLLSIYPKFADDFAGMASGSDAAAVEVILQDTLDKLQIWTKIWDNGLKHQQNKGDVVCR